MVVKKNPGRTGFKESRYKNEYVETVHYNQNDRKPCSVRVVNPQHSTDSDKVTCRYCLAFIRRQK